MLWSAYDDVTLAQGWVSITHPILGRGRSLSVIEQSGKDIDPGRMRTRNMTTNLILLLAANAARGKNFLKSP
jgi:hypothetical protein